jgi:hypothetical protein
MSLFPKFEINRTPAKAAKAAESLVKKASTLATLAGLAPPAVSRQKNGRVRCYDCVNLEPNDKNPENGLGKCAEGVPGAAWPHRRLRCDKFVEEDAPDY